MANIPFLNNAYFAAKVGIGTDSPTEKLEVDGRVKIQTTAGSLIIQESGAGSVKLTSSATLSIEALSNFRVRTGSLLDENFTVLSTGNVGIGTTNPGYKLDVSSGSAVGARISTSGFTNLDLVSNRTSGNLGGLRFKQDIDTYQAGEFLGLHGGGFDWKVGDGIASPGIKMRLDSSGNLGIGTTNPETKLTIENASAGPASSTYATTASNSNLHLSAVGVPFYNHLFMGIGSATYAWIQAQHGNSNAQNLALNPIGGNVGIGTDSPDAKLELSSAQPRIRLTDTITGISSGSTTGAIDFYTSDASSEGNAVNAKIESYADSIYGRLGLRFFTGGGGAPTQAMTINWVGNVGIGTTDPTADLHVQGSSATEVPIIRSGGFGNSGSKLELAETLVSGNMTYGFSFFNDGNSSNTLQIKSHNNSTAGVTAITINRTDALTTFSTVPIVGTRTAGDNTTYAASTAFVTAAITASAPPTVNDGTLTMTTTAGLDGGATFTANQSGNSAFAVSLDLSELADMTQTMIGSDEFIVLDNSAERRKAASEIGLSIFDNDAGYLTSGDLSGYLLNTTDTLTGSLSVTTQVITDSITLTGTFYSRVSNSTLALQRMDTRVDATNYSRTHWYGISDTGGTSNFRHAYYDGANYINATAASGRLTFSGKVAGSTPTAAGDLTTKAYVDAQTPGAGVFLPLAGGTLSSPGDLTVNGDVLLGGSAAAPKTITIQQIGVTTTDANAVMQDGSGVLKIRTLGTGAFGPTPVGAYLPLAGGTLTGNLTISVPDGGSAPAMTNTLFMKGYEGRGIGMKIRDSANSATSPSSREWFVGSGYSNSGFNIGYSSTGSSSSYSAQSKFNITVGGVVTIPGNVGIGTTNPLFKLQVQGSVALDVMPGHQSEGIVRIGRYDPNTSRYNDIKSYVSSTAASNYLKFSVHGGIADATVDVMTLKGSGNAGIGTTSPDAKLAVNGDFGIQGQLFTNTGTGVASGAGVANGFAIPYRTGITTLNDNYNYIVRLTTTGTGTDTGSYYLVGYNQPAAAWQARMVSRGGSGSNHPELAISGNTMVAYDNHVSGYTIRWSCETIGTGDPDGTLHNMGSDYQWQRNVNDLYYTDGNVGIGTTSPQAALDVAGDLRIDGYSTTTNEAGLYLYNNIAYSMASLANCNNSYNAFRIRGRNTATNTLGIGSNGNSDYVLQVVNDAGTVSGNISINPYGGNVGIGTTDPGAKLEVYGSSPNILINNTAETDSGIVFTDAQAGTGQRAAIKFSSSDQKLKFFVNDEVAQRMVIDTVGNVGIGTTNPTSALGSTKVLDISSTGNGEVILDHTDAGATSDLGLYSWARNNDHLAHIKATCDGSTSAAFISFHAQPSGGSFSNAASNEKMRIKSNGYVGIGTTSPDLKLDVVSGTNNGIRISATDTTSNWRDISIRSYVSETEADALGEGTHIYTSSPSGTSTETPFSYYGATVIQGRNNGNGGLAVRLGNGTGFATRMWIGATGVTVFSNTVTATNFILSSDERLKENIEKACDNRIKADWKTFELKTDKGQKRYGVIAQELEKTNPEFVREDTQGFKSVAYIDLLIAKIAELEARLEKLEK